jgi:hypothetical protein
MLIAYQIQHVVLGPHGDIDLKTLRIHINKLGYVHPIKTHLKEFNVILKLQRVQLHV